MSSQYNGSQGHVYSAVYADTEVLELIVEDVAIMRRVRDGAFNATQLFKLAGLDKPKRAKALDALGNYEKIQGGYGKFQGTWVPATVALGLAQQHQIYHLISPLLEFPLDKKAPSKEAVNVQSAPIAPLPPIEETHPVFGHSRELVTELFLNNGDAPDLQKLVDQVKEIEMDVPIDDSGHTALHWASALGSLDLVKSLIEHGSEPARGNFAGETALIRAVLVTNNSDLTIFGSLLECLSGSLYVRDHNGRSVLHHIILTSGISGRSHASRYYLETLLEWVVRKNALQHFASLVNAQDYNGDTALNIAARLGNRSLARQLMEVGADTMIANRAGLRPVDFCDLDAVTAAPSSQQPHQSQSQSQNQNQSTVLPPPPPQQPHQSNRNVKEKRKHILDSIMTSVHSLEGEFDRELAQKDALLQQVHQQLREATETLEMHRSHVAQINKLSNDWAGLQRSFASLDNAIRLEDDKFCQMEIQAGREPVGLDAEIDPDAPFTGDGEYMPPALLEARIAAYQQNNHELEDLRNELQKRSADLENKFRHVVSLSTNVPEDQIETLLDGLVQAVESDSRNVDMSRVASFLKKIESTS